MVIPETIRHGTVVVAYREPVVLSKRSPVAVDSGATFLGSCHPHPDLSHPATVQQGAKKRLGSPIPPYDPAWIRQCVPIVWAFVRRYLPKVNPDQVLPLELWLALTNYTEAEKDIIRNAPDIDIENPDPKFIQEFASFIKAEFYDEPKAARTIQGLSASLKKLLGPLIHACEHELFTMPHFAKFIPVSKRAKWMKEKFACRPGMKVAGSDFSSFEQTWQEAQLETFEMPVFEHMLSEIPGFRFIMNVIRMMEVGVVKLVFKWLTVLVGAVRKSGTTNTSFSNGAGNLLIHVCLGEILGLGELVGAFEGDDGLFNYSSGRFPSTDDYLRLGFQVKLQIFESPERASFCGIVYHPDDCINITDPIKVLNRIGWLSHFYARAKASKLKALLRAKAMSLCVQSPNCPILAECAQWLLRATRSIDCRWVMKARVTDWWTRQQYAMMEKHMKFVYTPHSPMTTRELMAEVYGVPIDVQLSYEAWFRSCDTIQHIPLLHDAPECHVDVAERFIRTSKIPALDHYPVFPDVAVHQERWVEAPLVTSEEFWSSKNNK